MYDLLGGLLSGSVENVTILHFGGGGLNVERIETMTTLRKKVDTNRIQVQEAVDQRLQVGAVLDMSGKGSDSKTDVGSNDGEHGKVESDNGILEQSPELGGAVFDVIERKV